MCVCIYMYIWMAYYINIHTQLFITSGASKQSVSISKAVEPTSFASSNFATSKPQNLFPKPCTLKQLLISFRHDHCPWWYNLLSAAPCKYITASTCTLAQFREFLVLAKEMRVSIFFPSKIYLLAWTISPSLAFLPPKKIKK